MKQMTFSDYEYSMRKRKTKREEFEKSVILKCIRRRKVTNGGLA